MIRILPKNIISFLILILIQTLILNNINLSTLDINPYIYLFFILMLPFETPSVLLLLMAFTVGLSVDIFSDTLGLHTAASVLMAFSRPYILQYLAPREGYEGGTGPKMDDYGYDWYFRYCVLTVLIHHVLFYFLEVFDLSELMLTIWKIILGTVFTSLIIIISEFIISSNK